MEQDLEVDIKYDFRSQDWSRICAELKCFDFTWQSVFKMVVISKETPEVIKELLYAITRKIRQRFNSAVLRAFVPLQAWNKHLSV